MKKLIAIVLAMILVLSFSGMALATPVSSTGPGPQGVHKDLDVTVTIDPAIWMDTYTEGTTTQKDALNLGSVNPLDNPDTEDSVDIVVKSNRAFKKDVGPGALTGATTGNVIPASRLSLNVDGADITDPASGWELVAGKYWSPEHAPNAEDRETLVVDLTVNWDDPADTYTGTLEVSAEQQ